MTDDVEETKAPDHPDLTIDDQPDWPPAASATVFPDGTHRYGSTGQVWTVVEAAWVRVKKATLEQMHMAGGRE